MRRNHYETYYQPSNEIVDELLPPEEAYQNQKLPRDPRLRKLAQREESRPLSNRTIKECLEKLRELLKKSLSGELVWTVSQFEFWLDLRIVGNEKNQARLWLFLNRFTNWQFEGGVKPEPITNSTNIIIKGIKPQKQKPPQRRRRRQRPPHIQGQYRITANEKAQAHKQIANYLFTLLQRQFQSQSELQINAFDLQKKPQYQKIRKDLIQFFIREKHKRQNLGVQFFASLLNFLTQSGRASFIGGYDYKIDLKSQKL